MEIVLRVPTQTYGFLEIKGRPDEISEMIATGNRYAEKPLTTKETTGIFGERVVTTFTGEKLKYCVETHRYTTLDGKPLLSGSHYAERFAEPFDRERILAATAKKLATSTDVVGQAWDLRGDMARTFGTALHKAMECYFKYNGIGYGIPKHPILRDAVMSFPKKDEKVYSEIMVSDLKRGLVGQIDALVDVSALGNGNGGRREGLREGVIWDFKSDADVGKNLVKHHNQLSFYAHILIAFGWKIRGIEVWNYTTKWECRSSEVLPLKLD